MTVDPMDETVLYDQFAAARRNAIAITDLYHQAAMSDPNRTEGWERVMRQTESARVLLERWLQLGKVAEARQPGIAMTNARPHCVRT